MTGFTKQLTRWQREELLRYRDGEPHRFRERPNTNLIRRDLLRLTPEAGKGFYRITQAGRDALDV
jgi:hypothetical protein